MDSPQISPPDIKGQGQSAVVVELSQQLTWSRKEAAIMCGVGLSTFSKWVREGFMPQPFRNGRFSADAIRNALSSISGGSQPVAAYDRWKAAS